MIDIIEQEVLNLSEKVFNLLLKDQTTKNNICWATDNYVDLGPQYMPQEPITKELITGVNTKLIKPRVAKDLIEKEKRVKDKAEVFTPSWVCNLQNNLVDDNWFGRGNVFNKVVGKTWFSTEEKKFSRR